MTSRTTNDVNDSIMRNQHNVNQQKQGFNQPESVSSRQFENEHKSNSQSPPKHCHKLNENDRSEFTQDLDHQTNQHYENYVPKVILLTGGAGFIGSHVMCHLVRHSNHYKVICLDKLAYCATESNFEPVANKEQYPNFVFIKGDICSSDLVKYIIESNQVDTILHFAAQTHVDNSFENSINFTMTNVMGTHILLEAARQYQDTLTGKSRIKRFIHVSTDEVYGESLLNSLISKSPTTSLLNPTNPYAATKVSAEYLVRSYYYSFALPCIITRGNNVYGERQFPEKIIPKFIVRLAKNLKCTLHGDGQNKRSFLYIDDVVQAFDIILHHGTINNIYNIGSEREFSNQQIVQILIESFYSMKLFNTNFDKSLLSSFSSRTATTTKRKSSLPCDHPAVTLEQHTQINKTFSNYQVSESPTTVIKSNKNASNGANSNSSNQPSLVSDQNYSWQYFDSNDVELSMNKRQQQQNQQQHSSLISSSNKTTADALFDTIADTTNDRYVASAYSFIDISPLVLHVVDRPYNDERYFIDSSSLRHLGWKPQTDFQTGIRKTIVWFMSVLLHRPDYWPIDLDQTITPHPKN